MSKRSHAARPCAAALALALAVASTAAGEEGVIEISQDQVLAGGGFPYTIAQPGSYLLTSNLMVPDANTTAILLSANDVTLDLNGFTIKGPTVCTGGAGAGTSCSPTGGGFGISGGAADNVTVRNGIVRGAGSAGIVLRTGARLEDLIVISNGSTGVQLTSRSSIRSTVIALNNGTGLRSGFASVITESSVVDNGVTGIDAFGSNVILRNAVSGNGVTGIAENGQASRIGENMVSGNGGNGVFCNNGCLVEANTIASNGNRGLQLGADAAYRNNVINDHAIEPVTGGVYLAPNTCDGVVSPLACDPP